MFCVSITGQTRCRIENANVYCDAESGNQVACYSLPIANARQAYAELGRCLREFDAERRVIKLRE